MGKRKRRVVESASGTCMNLAEPCDNRAESGRYLCRRHLDELEARAEVIKQKRSQRRSPSA